MSGARIGFIGLGIMGSRMAAKLADAGFELTVWNRTTSVARQWAAEHRAAVAATPAQVAAASDVVITIVVNGEQVEQLLLGPDGAAQGASEGLLCIDMSTIAPATTRRIGEQLGQRGIDFIDAPVTGSSPGAESGTLTIMAGGSAEQIARAQPIFDVLGAKTVHCGPLGDGQSAKLLSNAISATNAAVLAQVLVIAERAGLNLDALLAVIDSGSAGSTISKLKGEVMLTRDYQPLFRLDHMLKDVNLALDLAAEADTPFDYAQQTRALLEQASAAGFGDQDFAAVIEALQLRAPDQD